MRRKHIWLLMLLVVSMLVAACGPEMATPTPAPTSDAGSESQATTPAEEGQESEVPVVAAYPVDENDWHALGSPDAPLTMIEYSDFQWPYCAQYVRETFSQIVDTYVSTGQVRYVFRNFPLDSIHPQAQKAAEAAECAGEQGKYWELHDLLFEGQSQWSGSADAVDTFKEMAGELGLDQGQFDSCLDGSDYASKVTAERDEAVAAGVTSTPSFAINGKILAGAQPFAAFQQEIEYGLFLAGGGTVELEIGADSYRSLGEPDAPVVITEFADFQWPACGQIAREVIPDLIEQYVDTGKVRYVYREFPLNSIHPAAQKSSEAAVCAGELGSYWEMNEHLYATTDEWSAAEDPTAYFKEYADELGLDAAAFSECLDSGWAEDKIEADRLAGHELEVNATPYFFVNDLAIRGGLPIGPLGQVIDFVAAGGVMADIIPVGDDYHVFGDGEMAMAVAVVFEDYASPESAKNARDMLPVLEEGHIDTGDMIYVVHPWAQDADSPGGKAAIAAECAGEQGLYREMHSLLLEEQDSWIESEEPNALFVESAESLSADLDSSAYDACLDSEEAWLRVQASTVLAALNNLPGIPFFVFNNGQGWLTAQTAGEFKALLESNLIQ